MEKTIMYCDQCNESVGEKHTKDMDRIIKIDKDRDGNIWFGSVGRWLTMPTKSEHDRVFCTFVCFMNWLEKWHEASGVMKEDKA